MGQSQLLMDRVMECLRTQGWPFTVQEGKPVIQLQSGLGNMLNSCWAVIISSDHGILCYALSPKNAEKKNFPAVADYLMRANWGLRCGNFEMNHASGEIRYKTYLRASVGIPDVKDVITLVNTPFQMMHKFGDGLVRALEGSIDVQGDAAEAK